VIRIYNCCFDQWQCVFPVSRRQRTKSEWETTKEAPQSMGATGSFWLGRGQHCSTTNGTRASASGSGQPTTWTARGCGQPTTWTAWDCGQPCIGWEHRSGLWHRWVLPSHWYQTSWMHLLEFMDSEDVCNFLKRKHHDIFTKCNFVVIFSRWDCIKIC